RRSGGPVRGAAEGAERIALDAALRGPRGDRPHGVGLASHASARLRGPLAVVHQSATLRRLFTYSRPYRGRMVWALAGMILYAAGSGRLAYLIKPIFDSVLPKQEDVTGVAWAIVGVYFLKGVGSYVSSYLMADVGQ